jgi:hypothetical protein
MNLDALARGDLIECDWVDIYEDSTGDPDTISLPLRRSIGYFWSRTTDKNVNVLVTTTTIDSDVANQQGFCAYPEACIVAVKVIKRKRRKSRRVSVSAEGK